MKEMYNSRLFRFGGLFLGVLVWLANASNPPTGKTGAPFNGHCNECHNGGNPNGFNGTVEVDGMPGTVESNTTYPLTITLTPTAGSPVRGGFQLVSVDGNNANAGDLTAGNAQSGTEFFGGREYIEQRGAKTFTGGGPATWNFNWKSPVTAAGSTIKFYFIGNFTNGNNNSSGDFPIAFSNTYPFNGPPPVTATITNVTNLLCNGVGTGSITVEGNGGIAPYTYLWSGGGQTTATAVNLLAGTYTVTVTGASGTGTATASAVVTQPPVLNASASSTGTLTCANTSVTATATATGGTPPYSYVWSNGNTGSPTTLTTPGLNTVTATDNNGCTKVASVNVPSNLVAPNAVAGPSVTLTCAQPTAALNGTGSSTGANMAYLWTPSNGGNIVSGATTLFPVVNAAGTYTLKVTNNTNGCTSTAVTTATSTVQQPTANTTGGQLTCTITTTTVSVTTDAANPTFSWAGPNGFTSTQQTPNVTAGGTYTVTVTNTSTGCSKTATATVTQNITAPVTTANGGTLTCAATSVALASTSNASGATFAWVGPNNYSSTQQNPTVSIAGTYTVTSTNPANGCTSSATATVSQNTTPPTATASGGTLTCAATSVTLNAGSNAANATYSWTGPNGYTSNLQNPAANTAGTYTVTVNNPANGCTATATATAGQNTTAPSANATAGQITCASASAPLNVTTNAGDPGFAWTGPNNYTSTLQNPTTTTVGTYTVVVLDSVNGCTASGTAVVNLNTTPPVASAFAPGNLNCNTTSLQLNGTASSQGPSFSYLWTTANGNIVSGATTLTPTVNAAGTYTLQVTNASNGCTATTTVAVVQSPPVTVSIGNIANVSCNGGSNGAATATGGGGSGAYTYLWSNSATTAGISGLAAGTYIVTTTDGANCTATASVTISQPAVLLANATATAETAAGANNGTATAAPSGGTPGFTYAWSNSGNAATIANLTPGNYTVTVLDANNCTAVQTVTVNSFNCAISANISTVNVTCNGANNGSATASVSGAAQPVTYLWSNNATTAAITNLAPGMYTVSIVDANNCPVVLSTTISQPQPLMANASATGQSAVGVNDGTATAQPTGGTGSYAYAWSNSATTQSITGLAPGAYTVSVTDANSCSSVQTVVVTAFNCALSATVSTVNVLCAGGNNGQATAIPGGATPPVTYQWSSGATTATAANLSAGLYTATITDGAGCIATVTATISQPQPLVTSVSNVVNVVCPEDKTGSAVVNASGGTLPYAITWPNASNGQNLGVGTYAVSVTDGNNCTTTQTVSIISTDNTAPTITCPVAIPVPCAGTPLQFDNPAVADNCNLNGVQAVLIAGLPSGSVFPVGETVEVFRITDASGNSATCSFTIKVEPPIEIVLNGFNNDVNNAGVGSINVTVIGGGVLTYNWTKDGQPFATTEDLSGLKAGVYVLVVTNENGCKVSLPPVTIDNALGADDLNDPVFVRVFPNPARYTLRLETKGVEPVAVRIMDLHGRLLRDLQPSEWGTDIDVSFLPGGLYSLFVVADNGRQYAALWVKSE